MTEFSGHGIKGEITVLARLHSFLEAMANNPHVASFRLAEFSSL